MKFNGESIWTSTAEYAMKGIAALHFFIEKWTVRLRHTVVSRIQLAHSIDEADIDGRSSASSPKPAKEPRIEVLEEIGRQVSFVYERLSIANYINAQCFLQ
jgi:hypothetical protein